MSIINHSGPAPTSNPVQIIYRNDLTNNNNTNNNKSDDDGDDGDHERARLSSRSAPASSHVNKHRQQQQRQEQEQEQQQQQQKKHVKRNPNSNSNSYRQSPIIGSMTFYRVIDAPIDVDAKSSSRKMQTFSSTKRVGDDDAPPHSLSVPSSSLLTSPTNENSQDSQDGEVKLSVITVRDKPFMMKLLGVKCCGVQSHYGYFLLVVCGWLQTLSAAGSTFGVGFYTESLINELNISRTNLSLAWMTALFVTSISLPFIGRAVDRFGPRFVALSLTIPFGGSLYALSYAVNVWSVAAALVLLRLCVAAVQLIVMNVSNQWFVRRKGFALSVVYTVAGFGLLYPSWLAGINSVSFVNNQWRTTMRVESVAITAMYILCALSIYDRPEQYGLRVDARAVVNKPLSGSGSSNSRLNALMNDASSDVTVTVNANNNDLSQPLNEDAKKDNNSSRENSEEEEETEEKEENEQGELEIHWHWKDVLATRMFWVVVIGSCTTGLLWSGFNFDYESILGDTSAPSSTSDWIFIPVSVGDAVMMLIAGAMFDALDRKPRGQIVAVMACAGAATLLLTMQGVTMAVLFGLVYGVMDAIHSVGYGVVFSYTYGRVNLGTIDSIAGAIQTFSLGVGTVAFGLCKESTGSYRPMFYALICSSVLTACALWFVEKPKPPTRQLVLSDERQ